MALDDSAADKNRRVTARAAASFPQSARRRVLVAFMIGVVAGLGASWWAPWQLTAMASWDAAAIAILLRVWLQVARFTPDETKRFATREDDSRASAELLLVGASVASLGAVAL